MSKKEKERLREKAENRTEKDEASLLRVSKPEMGRRLLAAKPPRVPGGARGAGGAGRGAVARRVDSRDSDSDSDGDSDGSGSDSDGDGDGGGEAAGAGAVAADATPVSSPADDADDAPARVTIGMVGHPNVGKSSVIKCVGVRALLLAAVIASRTYACIARCLGQHRHSLWLYAYVCHHSTICGAKRVSVSRTPGHTKWFQSINITEGAAGVAVAAANRRA
jgi:hypothetical protein